MKIFVIVPVFNEDKKIVNTIREIKKYAKNIIVVNDGSTDKTSLVLKKINNIVLIDYLVNKGKGYAMRVGAEKAWDLGAEAVIFIDGDGQHNPKHINSFTTKLKNKDLVIGIRHLKGEMPILRRIGNTTMFSLVNLLFGVHIKDLLCGFRAMKKSVYNDLVWSDDRYGVEAEMTCLAGNNSISFDTVEVETVYLNKKHGLQPVDGIKIMLHIFKLWIKLNVKN